MPRVEDESCGARQAPQDSRQIHQQCQRERPGCGYTGGLQQQDVPGFPHAERSGGERYRSYQGGGGENGNDQRLIGGEAQGVGETQAGSGQEGKIQQG